MKPSYQNQRPSYTLPNRNWIRRNPRAFQIIVLTSAMLTLFSRPLYEAFFSDNYYTPPAPPAKK